MKNLKKKWKIRETGFMWYGDMFRSKSASSGGFYNTKTRLGKTPPRYDGPVEINVEGSETYILSDYLWVSIADNGTIMVAAYSGFENRWFMYDVLTGGSHYLLIGDPQMAQGSLKDLL